MDAQTSIQVEAYETALRELMEHNRAKNQIIRELMTWIAEQLPLDQYLKADDKGRELWDRAREATR
jgi:hypothetical protein